MCFWKSKQHRKENKSDILKANFFHTQDNLFNIENITYINNTPISLIATNLVTQRKSRKRVAYCKNGYYFTRRANTKDIRYYIKELVIGKVDKEN